MKEETCKGLRVFYCYKKTLFTCTAAPPNFKRKNNCFYFENSLPITEFLLFSYKRNYEIVLNQIDSKAILHMIFNCPLKIFTDFILEVKFREALRILVFDLLSFSLFRTSRFQAADQRDCHSTKPSTNQLTISFPKNN